VLLFFLLAFCGALRVEFGNKFKSRLFTNESFSTLSEMSLKNNSFRVRQRWWIGDSIKAIFIYQTLPLYMHILEQHWILSKHDNEIIFIAFMQIVCFIYLYMFVFSVAERRCRQTM